MCDGQRQPVPHGLSVTCDAAPRRFITAFASLELAASTRLAAPITLVALERSNEGVGDGQRQPVPHVLSVRAAWRAIQHQGTAGCVRIARDSGIDAASSHDHAGGTRAMQRGMGDNCELILGLSSTFDLVLRS